MNLECIMRTSSIRIDGMLLMLLLSFCAITIHGFIFQQALNIAGCLVACRNVSQINFFIVSSYNIDVYMIYFISV